jgi:AraC-like DNA-binding protein
VTEKMEEARNLKTEHIYRAAKGAPLYKVVPVFTGMGIQEVNDGTYSWLPHRHSRYELILVESGSYRCFVNDFEMQLGAEDFLIIKPGDWHEDYCEPPIRYFGLSFYIENSFGADGRQIGLFSEDCLPEHQKGRIEDSVFRLLLERIACEYKTNDHFSAHIQDAVLLELFWHLARRLPREGLSQLFLDLSFEQYFVTRLLRFFDANICRNLKVSEMARHLGMGESSFAHKCSEVLGVPPGKAFLKARMDQAAKMLKNSNVSIKEAAAFFGFDNQYHFSRAFKSCFGKSPSFYR